MIKYKIHLFLLCFLLMSIVSCGTSLVIENVDYSQPLESILTPNSDNLIHDKRYAIQFSISEILEAEGLETVNEIHLIRNVDGYYFLTAGGFQNVYIFEPEKGELELFNTVEFVENTLREPAFNQRKNYIELVELSDRTVYKLNEMGFLEEDNS